MITNIEIDEAEVAHYNEVSKKLLEEGTISERHERIPEDFLIPYSKMLDMPDFREFLYTPESRKSFEGIYFTTNTDIELFCKNYDLNKAKTYTPDLPGFIHTYGVADNASQILDYYDNYKKEYPTVNFDDCIIAVMGIFKDHQPKQGGWRWHRWGKYIGKYHIQHEYLYDEDIQFVLVWELLFLKPKA